MSAVHTNLAEEFDVLSMLDRRGADVSLTLGNKNAGDIVVALSSEQTATIDVKGVVGPRDWPCDNLRLPTPAHGFIVRVSFEGKMAAPHTISSVWGVPADEITPFIKAYAAQKVIVRSAIRTQGKPYWQAWSRIMEASSPSVPRLHDPPRLTEVLRRCVTGVGHARWCE